MLPINNAANSLGLGSKKYSEHFTPNALHTYLSIFFMIFFRVNIKNRKINIYFRSKQEKKYKNVGKF